MVGVSPSVNQGRLEKTGRGRIPQGTPAPEEGRALLGIGAFLGQPQGIAVVVIFVALAAAAGLFVTPMNAVLQREAPGAERCRFIACSNVVDAGFMVGSAIVAAVLVAAGLDPIAIMAITGLTGLPVALGVARFAPGTPLGRIVLRWFPRAP